MKLTTTNHARRMQRGQNAARAVLSAIVIVGLIQGSGPSAAAAPGSDEAAAVTATPQTRNEAPPEGAATKTSEPEQSQSPQPKPQPDPSIEPEPKPQPEPPIEPEPKPQSPEQPEPPPTSSAPVAPPDPSTDPEPEPTPQPPEKPESPPATDAPVVPPDPPAPNTAPPDKDDDSPPTPSPVASKATKAKAALPSPEAKAEVTKIKLLKAFTVAAGDPSAWTLSAMISAHAGGYQSITNRGDQGVWTDVQFPDELYVLSESSQTQSALFEIDHWTCLAGDGQDYANKGYGGGWWIEPPAGQSVTCTAYNKPIAQDAMLTLTKQFAEGTSGNAADWELTAASEAGSLTFSGSGASAQQATAGESYQLTETSPSASDYDLVGWSCRADGGGELAHSADGGWSVTPIAGVTTVCTATNQIKPTKLQLGIEFDPPGSGDATAWELSAAYSGSAGSQQITMPGGATEPDEVDYPGQKYVLSGQSDDSGLFQPLTWSCSAADGDGASQQSGTWSIAPPPAKTTTCIATAQAKTTLSLSKQFDGSDKGDPTQWTLTASHAQQSIEMGGDSAVPAMVGHPGESYQLSEEPVSVEVGKAYRNVGWDCRASDNPLSGNLARQDQAGWSVTPTENATIACVASNAQTTRLRLAKAFTPAGAGDPSQWSLTAIADSETPTDVIVAPGDTDLSMGIALPGVRYYLSEDSEQAGDYTFDSWSCVDQLGGLVPVDEDLAGQFSFVPAVGQSITCTALSNRNAQLLLNKEFDPTSSGGDPNAWTMTATAGGPGSPPQTVSMGGDSTTPQRVSEPGERYYLGESSSSQGDDYVLSGWSCVVDGTGEERASQDEDHGWYVIVNWGETVSCAATNTPLSDVDVAHEPLGTPKFEAATSTWSQDYVITVRATDSSKPARFTLTDSVPARAGVTFGKTEAYDLGSSKDPASRSLIAGWAPGNPIAADVVLPAGQQAHYYLVSLTGLTIDPLATGFEPTCASGGGLFAEASATSIVGANSAPACADVPTGRPTAVKRLIEQKYLGQGTWRVSYEIDVANAPDGLSVYSLTDSLGVQPSWVTSSRASGSASSGLPLSVMAGWNGTSMTQLADRVVLQPAEQHGYTIEADVTIPRGTGLAATTCGPQSGGVRSTAEVVDGDGVRQPAESCFNATTFAVGGAVWFDQNGNGRNDPREPKARGITVRLTAADGGPARDATGGLVADEVTDDRGRFWFDELAAGPHRISFGSIPPGYAVRIHGTQATLMLARAGLGTAQQESALILLAAGAPGIVSIENAGGLPPTRVLYANAAAPSWQASLVQLSPIDPPDPVVPDPVAPDPVVPDPDVPDPDEPDPVVPDPNMPDPVVPDPVVPDPDKPDPDVPDPAPVLVPEPRPVPVSRPVDQGVVPRDGGTLPVGSTLVSPRDLARSGSGDVFALGLLGLGFLLAGGVLARRSYRRRMGDPT